MESIGRYRILKRLGGGGFGEVYLGHDDRINRDVAIKVFNPKDENLIAFATSTDDEGLQVLQQRFLKEAQILGHLEACPNIINVLDFGELDDGSPYYVMPYLPRSLVAEVGRDVFDVNAINDLEENERPHAMPLEKALTTMHQLLQGVAAAHEHQLVHRDIKPANVMLTNNNEVRLVDFGIAKAPDGQHSTVSQLGMGSRNYMAPEQRESAKHVDARADVYSLGALAYRLITGRLPTGRYADPDVYCKALNKPLNQLTLDCLAEDKNKRPNDAAAVLTRWTAGMADSNSSHVDESTGTWIHAGQSGLKDELLPLRDKIASLLKAHGEVPEEEKAKLTILAEMADLNSEQLDALIEETYQGIEQDVKPKRKFLEVLDNKLAATGSLNQSDHEALSSAASSVGWDEDTLNTIIERRKPTSSKKNKGKTSQQKPEKTQHQSQPNKNHNPIAWVIGLLLVCILAYSAWWYNNLQEEQTDKVQQQINEEQQISLAEETKTQEDAALAKREAAKLAAEVEAAKEETEKRRKAEAVIALVKATQVELNRIGYAVGRADGAVGNKTRNAIKHYQKGNNLSPTGETSNSLLAHLKQSTKKPGLTAVETFKDCTNCPAMVVIPAGTFQMGSSDGDSNEKPDHNVNIAKSFAMGKYEVTWNEYQPCIDAGVCSSGGDAGFGKGNRPVIKVSWDNADTYVNWLSKQTGKKYRLPSEAEWEYTSRAGSNTEYSWGDSISCSKAHYGNHYNGNCGNDRKTVAVGTFGANAFGLYDVHGNVAEWVQDCYTDNYNNTPRDGNAHMVVACHYRVLRGGSWDNRPEYLRSSNRKSGGVAISDYSIGFRLARDL